MDPLTITSTVISLSQRCVTSARELYLLREKYKDASMTITAIYSESNVIATSLAHIQGLCMKSPDALRSTLQERPELLSTFDQALTGCVLVYSVLDDEVQRLYDGVGREGMAAAMAKMKLLWKEEAMKDVLTQIRGQQTALSLLIQALQMTSIHEIRALIENNIGTFQSAAQRLVQFRRANPKVKAPSSVFEVAIDDAASIYSSNSTATSTNFIFDDLVVNSQAYRRALNQSRSFTHLAPLQEQSEIPSDTDTVVEGMPSKGLHPKYNIPLRIQERLSPSLVAALVSWTDEVVKEWSEREVQTKTGELVADSAVLREKYVKVKKYYFEMQHQKDEQIREREMLAAEYSRVVAEKAETEHEKQFLQGQVQEHYTFFSENEAKRKQLVEAHAKELKLKEDKILRLEDQCTKEREISQKLKESLTAKSSQVETMEEDVNLLKTDFIAAITKLKACEEQLAKTIVDNDAKAEELQRYKGFDTIIEQLRLLSPAPPTSPGATSSSTSALGIPPMPSKEG